MKIIIEKDEMATKKLGDLEWIAVDLGHGYELSILPAARNGSADREEEGGVVLRWNQPKDEIPVSIFQERLFIDGKYLDTNIDSSGNLHIEIGRNRDEK